MEKDESGVSQSNFRATCNVPADARDDGCHEHSLGSDEE
jgi:hypothetical protein